MNTFKIVVSRERAPLPAGAGAGVVNHDVAHSAMQLILEDGEYACETTFTVHGKVTMGCFQTVKSVIKMEPIDDGGMVLKVESSYKLVPVPRVQEAPAVQEETPETHEMGGPSFKVKQD